MKTFERLRPPSRDNYEFLGLDEDQIQGLVDGVVRDLRAAEYDSRLPRVFYATQNSLLHSRDILWKVVYFKVDDSDPSRPKLVKGDLSGGDYPFALDLADGCSSIRNAFDDHYTNLRPLTQPSLLSESQLGCNHQDHYQPMVKSADYVNHQLVGLNGR